MPDLASDEIRLFRPDVRVNRSLRENPRRPPKKSTLFFFVPIDGLGYHAKLHQEFMLRCNKD
jgi:hypothetical protein